LASSHAIGALRSRSLIQIALQYVLAHRALEGRLPIGIGLQRSMVLAIDRCDIPGDWLY
jgi:hypothetical protein